MFLSMCFMSLGGDSRTLKRLDLRYPSRNDVSFVTMGATIFCFQLPTLRRFSPQRFFYAAFLSFCFNASIPAKTTISPVSHA